MFVNSKNVLKIFTLALPPPQKTSTACVGTNGCQHLVGLGVLVVIQFYPGNTPRHKARAS